MSPDPLVPIRLVASPEAPHLAWALGMRFSLPQSFLVASRLVDYRDGDGNMTIPPTLSHGLVEGTEDLRLRRAFIEKPPLSARLPFSYQWIPAPGRMLFARALGFWQRRRVRRWASFPGWPLDLSADLLADLIAGPSPPLADEPTPVLLTHDIDSPEGLRRLVEQFLSLEEKVGARSTNFLVPCSWKLDTAALGEIKQRGHFFGTHGYDHSNRTAFLPEAERKQRLAEGKRTLAEWEPVGYRAPSLVRTAELLRDLAGLYSFDSSIPTSGGLFPVPNNGCASARPFILEGILEIPLSLPRDGSLRFLGDGPSAIVQTWIECAAHIRRSRGVVVLLTHCEARFSGNPAMLSAYQQFLEHIAGSPEYRWAEPAEIVNRFSGRPCVEGAL